MPVLMIYALVEEDFRQPLLECPVDLRKLQTLINFNIHERYAQLLEFFNLHNFMDEIRLVETKLSIIKHEIKSSASNDSSTSTKRMKRKCAHTNAKNDDVLIGARRVTVPKEISQSPAKHSKLH